MVLKLIGMFLLVFAVFCDVFTTHQGVGKAGIQEGNGLIAGLVTNHPVWDYIISLSGAAGIGALAFMFPDNFLPAWFWLIFDSGMAAIPLVTAYDNYKLNKQNGIGL